MSHWSLSGKRWSSNTTLFFHVEINHSQSLSFNPEVIIWRLLFTNIVKLAIVFSISSNDFEEPNMFVFFSPRLPTNPGTTLLCKTNYAADKLCHGAPLCPSFTTLLWIWCTVMCSWCRIRLNRTNSRLGHTLWCVMMWCVFVEESELPLLPINVN